MIHHSSSDASSDTSVGKMLGPKTLAVRAQKVLFTRVKKTKFFSKNDFGGKTTRDSRVESEKRFLS